jgi:predicted transcriptional regulator YheO
LSNITINTAIINIVQALKVLDDADADKRDVAIMWKEMGLDVEEVAEKLSISPRQVYRYLKEINDGPKENQEEDQEELS